MIYQEFEAKASAITHPDSQAGREELGKRKRILNLELELAQAKGLEGSQFKQELDELDNLRKQMVDDYDKAYIKLNAEFKDALAVEYGLADHPKLKKVFAYAWQEGRSGGYSQVECIFCDIADLVR